MSESNQPNLGINSWLQDELYQTYLHDKKNVDESWKNVFDKNGIAKTPVNGALAQNGLAQKAHANGTAKAPVTVAALVPENGEELVALRGVAGKIAANMNQSLTVPTATSQRAVPVKALEHSRAVVNQQRAAQGQTKLSFTQLISWAIVQALAKHPEINHAFAEQNGEYFRLVRRHIGLGIAVDVKGKDGSSSLMVPSIKIPNGMSFTDYLAAFDDVVARARNGKLQMPDFQGTTISLTNPGTVGTLSSVPRLVVGQGAIIATGAMDYPAEYATVPQATKDSLGLSKVMMITCTYDHRVIQGADSGRFLGTLQSLLTGADGFYDRIFTELGVENRTGTLTVAAPQAAPVHVAGDAPATHAGGQVDAQKEAAVAQLVDAYRIRGHLLADLDPLGSKRQPQPDLDPASFGLTEADLDRRFVSQNGRSLREVWDALCKTYSGHIACEYMYIQYSEQREWLKQRMESTVNNWPIETATRLRALHLLIRTEEFEHFLHARFIGKKRFSLEGGETSVTFLDETLELASKDGVQEVVMGMAHRGRLAILANVVGKPLHTVFSEFTEAPDSASNAYGSGDVKYHLGASSVRKSQGREITVSMCFNPSHLEAVNPVVQGLARTKQDLLGDQRREKVLPILIHGDAAFAGQGVVMETLNLSQLEGYGTGGTIHLVTNNQLGFTTMPADARSGVYATDIARSIQAPIFHVNGDDPEAVLRVTQLAYDFRQRFKRDVVIDLICYRRWGHNEGDDPSYTQPLMYKAIKAQPPVVSKYSEELVAAGVTTKQEVEESKKQFVTELSEAFDLAKKNADAYALEEVPVQLAASPTVDTAIDVAAAERVIQGLTSIPADLHLNPKLKGAIEKRKELLSGGSMDWALGEAMAFGSLLLEGNPVRLSGQDSGRGTFSQRHLEFFDVEDGHKYVPMKHLSPDQAPFEVFNSSLSEYAVMGFEFGYSLGEPQALVMWEGQFGDFVNGAQIMIDQFLSSAETKWGEQSGLVLLLPHGYEGQGPEHSSARIERFLQLCAEGNMQVANCTTPAQYFHILRWQMKGGTDGKPTRKPLILFTPKSLLRHPRAISHLEDLTRGRFEAVLNDTGGVNVSKISRLLLCSGKIYYDLLEGREKRKADHVAIARVERLYPFPKDELTSLIEQYSASTEIYWVQEEPRNMGPWRFMMERLQPVLDITKRTVRYAGRPEAASPAAGTSKRHEQEQSEIVDDSFAAQPVTRRPKRVRLVKKKK